MLAEGDSIDGLWHLPPPAAALLTLSGGGKALRAWSAADGSLLWERLLIGERAAGPAPAQALLLENGVVVTMTAGTVQVCLGFVLHSCMRAELNFRVSSYAECQTYHELC